MAKLGMLMQQLGLKNHKLPVISCYLPNICVLDYTLIVSRMEI